MEECALRPFRNFRWIVADPELLGGKLAVRGSRFSVSSILSCVAEGMAVEEIEETYGRIPHEAIPELMRVASENPGRAECGCLTEHAEAGPRIARRVWNRGMRGGRLRLGRIDEQALVEGAYQAGLRVVLQRDRLFSESAARALRRFRNSASCWGFRNYAAPSFFVNSGKLGRGPIHPVAGQLSRSPEG